MVWFTEDDLRGAAGDGSFRRGREYVDAVAELQPTALGVRAAVRGRCVYEVWLGRDNDELIGECGCPFGVEGNFCKHCVAVGLVLLASGSSGPEADIEAYLRSLEQRELVELVLEQASRDPDLYRQLTLRAGSTGAPQVAVLRRQLDTALRVRGFVDADYAGRARHVLDTVRDLVDAGHAAEARPLARHAVELLTEAMGAVDDPAETIAGVARRAVKLYARACAVARPNPAKLASWLFQSRLTWPTWPTIDIGDFTEPLGESGMAAYRTLVDDAWHALDDDDDDGHTVLRGMREQLAKTSGDVDTLVDVLADGLPAVRAYREIVSVLRHAGRLDEAVRWAERGVAETRDLSLTELLVESFLDAQRGDEAVELRKADLRAARTRVCYGRLRDTAVAAKVWSGLRSWALDVLPPDELVGALLDDGDGDAAWLAAVKHDCAGVEVVRSRAETHPAEVLAAYRTLVTECLSRGGRECYREAGVLLKEMAACAQRCGESVSGFVASLKLEHARRPALLDELRRAGF
jgi:hypothetical protein